MDQRKSSRKCVWFGESRRNTTIATFAWWTWQDGIVTTRNHAIVWYSVC